MPASSVRRQSQAGDSASFVVSRDHIALLKALNMRIATFITGDHDLGTRFQNQPVIDEKRPFGNSGDPAEDALRVIKTVPAGPDGEYTPDQISYGRYLILSLPMAYEAVMSTAEIEPSRGRVDKFSSASTSFRRKRVIEYWRDAIDESVEKQCADSEKLITFLMNSVHPEDPISAVRELMDFGHDAKWVQRTIHTFRKHGVKKYRTAHPDLPETATDKEIWDGLLDGSKTLAYDW